MNDKFVLKVIFIDVCPNMVPWHYKMVACHQRQSQKGRIGGFRLTICHGATLYLLYLC